MLAGPRRVMRAGLPRFSRRWTYGTVRLSASHAVFAPEAAIASCVMSEPGRGGAAATLPGPAPAQAYATGPTSERARYTTRRGRRALGGSLPLEIGRASCREG